MGHRLSVVLIVLNTMGFFACLHFTRSIQPVIRMFITALLVLLADSAPEPSIFVDLNHYNAP